MRFEFTRQLVHLSGLLFVIVAQFIARELAVLYFLIITLFFLAYSLYVRSQDKKLANFIGRFESKLRDFALGLERKDAKNPFIGAMFFYLGCTLAFAFFSLPIASAACAMLAVGDAFATLTGVKFGRRRIGKKSLEGAVACFFASLAAGVFFVNPYLAVTGAFAASLAELNPWLDDNLVIPIASGLVMVLMSLFI
jgi:dolichol kinase